MNRFLKKTLNSVLDNMSKELTRLEKLQNRDTIQIQNESKVLSLKIELVEAEKLEKYNPIDKVELEVPTHYPEHHPKAGYKTFFVEKIKAGLEISEIIIFPKRKVNLEWALKNPKALLISKNHQKLYMFDNWFAYYIDDYGENKFSLL